VDYEEIMKQNGLKRTKNRFRILKILDIGDIPLSAGSIYNCLKEEEIEVSLSTVYRTLEKLSEMNIIRKLTFNGDNSTFFESIKKGHRHYLICLKCRSITVLNKCPIKGYQEDIEKETSYIIEGHKLDMYGYCPKCKDK